MVIASVTPLHEKRSNTRIVRCGVVYAALCNVRTTTVNENDLRKNCTKMATPHGNGCQQQSTHCGATKAHCVPDESLLLRQRSNKKSVRFRWRQRTLWRHVSPFILHLLVLVICCSTLGNAATVPEAGTPNSHTQYRRAVLYAQNNFTDLTAVDLNEIKGATGGEEIGFNAASSVQMPDSKINAGCPPTTSSHCLRCNNEGCIKCPVYLVTDTRQCVDRCPSGYIDQWSAHTEFMGRVCVSTGYSGPLMAALAGLLGGFLVCLTLLAVAVMLVRRRRRRKSIKQKLINENTMDRSDFLRQLNEMRPNAEYFLAMLNDTRRQIRKLYLSGEVAAANSYRPIVRDLAKILILLNRPIELIPAAPHDWNRLYAWSEQALERYKPQVGHLIDFFQAPGGAGEDFDAMMYRQKGGIFRQGALQSTAAGSAGGTAAQKLHMFGSLISLHEFDEPRSSDPFGSSFNTLKGGNLISDLNASSLWLEDEFYKLGFRPQDEITTEL